MKFASRVKETLDTTLTSAAVLTLRGAAANFRTLGKAIAATKLAINDITVFTVEDSAGNWEEGLYKIDSATQLTRQSVISSSNDGAAVVFPNNTTKVVYNTVSGDYITSLLAVADGYTIGQMASIGSVSSILDTFLLEIFDPASGNSYSAPISTLKALFGSQVAATGITMTGPTTGTVSTQSTNFTVGVTPVGGAISGTITVTPSDSGGGGTFSPTTLSITSSAPTATFKYTPSATTGARTISITNSANLANPANITYTVAAAAATTYTVTGPASGQVSVASTNFTVAATGTLSSNVTVTPSDSGGGGTFSPITVTLTPAQTSATFTYTPSATAGAKTLSFTNSGSLTNPANITYTANAAATQTITVNTPATQTVGTPFNVTGTYANGTPTALDYSIDGGSTWTAATSPTISGGTYSFSVTPTTASASRTMMVRDHTTLVFGTSGTYVVNAAPTSTYTVAGYSSNTVKSSLDMTSASVSGGKKYVNPGVPCTDGYGYFVIKNSGTQIASGATGYYAGWSQSNTTPPSTTIAGGQANTGANNTASFVQMGVNATAAQVLAYFWAAPSENGNWYLWFKFPDGSTTCFNPSAPLVVSGA